MESEYDILMTAIKITVVERCLGRGWELDLDLENVTRMTS